jgi:PAS domain S-box-containing protein
MSDDASVSKSIESRVLILAPTANDARLTASFLEKENVAVEICRDLPDLCGKVEEGCGALLLAEEVLVGDAVASLIDVLARQPAWSDLPITIITSGGEVSQARLRRLGVFGRGGNVTLLERPFRPATLVSTVEVALRARRRQHEVRGLLQKLQSGEERLQGILDSISDAFISIDRDWRIAYMNPGYLKLVFPIFKSDQELIGQNIWEKFPDIVDSDVGRFYRRMMDDQTQGTFEIFYEPLQAWLEIRAFPSSSGLSLYVQNITTRKEQENALAALTRKITDQARIFDTTLSNISDFAYTFDREGRFIYVNKPLLDLWGLTLPEASGKNFFDLNYPPDLAGKLQRQIESVFETGETITDETPYTSPSGVEGWYEYIFSPVLADDGSVEIVAGSTRVITERRKAEEDARQLAAIVKSSDDAIISKNLDGVIVSWNEGAERLFGYKAHEAIGNPVTMLIPPEHHDEEPAILQRIRNAEQIDHYETIRRRKDGELIAVSLSVSPIKDHTGKVVGASKIARDITEQKKSERALQDAKNAAEAANRSKDHFLAVLSHELRTPLTPVLMTVSSLEADPTIPPALRADMAMIRRNVDLETKLIDDLLDLSRITSGKLPLHLRSTNLNEAVRQVCEICEQQILEKGIRMELSLDKAAGHVRADPARLQQMLWNILKNAAKFTSKEGTVHVSTQCLPDGMVGISVRDTGIGIDPDVLPKIFEAFEQGDIQITRQFGGLGLGLAITRALVKLHDGDIRAESEGVGKGSTFVIQLPAAIEDHEQANANAPVGQPHHALRVLVVEDHVDTAAMLARLLGLSGYDTTVANSAGRALEIAEGKVFDIVVSDIGLPDSTGHDFMRRLRGIREIKGIAMSGYGMEEDIRKSLEAGFSEHLVKPVNLLSLEQAIRRLAQTIRAQERVQ